MAAPSRIAPPSRHRFSPSPPWRLPLPARLFFIVSLWAATTAAIVALIDIDAALEARPDLVLIAAAAAVLLIATQILTLWAPMSGAAANRPKPLEPEHRERLRLMREALQNGEETAADDDDPKPNVAAFIRRELTLIDKRMEALTLDLAQARIGEGRDRRDEEFRESALRKKRRAIAASVRLCDDALRFAGGEAADASRSNWFDLKRCWDEWVAAEAAAIPEGAQNDLQRPFLVYADGDRLCRLLSFLLRARLVAPGDGRDDGDGEAPPPASSRIALRLRGRRAPQRTILEIEDDAGGFPSLSWEALSRLFAAPREKWAAFGLEAALAAETVHLHGAEIRLEKNKGGGGVLTIALPQPDARKSMVEQVGDRP